MNLELLNNLYNEEKSKKLIKNFSNKINNETVSVLDEILNKYNETNELRDKLLSERFKILTDYASQNIDKGEFYYIYQKASDDNQTYLMAVFGKEQTCEIFKINKEIMPANSNIDSILRKKEEKFYLDEEATEYIKSKMREKFQIIINGKENKNKIEGHIYEFVESSGNSAWLIDTNSPLDKSNNAYDVFEDTEFPLELLKSTKEGDLFKYINGKYERIK